MKQTFGLAIILWALMFSMLSTNYFGGNWLPQTNEEIICDITTLLLCICGIILKRD